MYKGQDSSINPIIIVGAGWAGLAAALALARQTSPNQSIIILEAAPQAGGRARRVPFDDQWVDNGQHLLVGAYEKILKLLSWLNIEVNTLFHRSPLELFLLKPSLTNIETSEILETPEISKLDSASASSTLPYSSSELHLRFSDPFLNLTFFNRLQKLIHFLMAKGLTLKERFKIMVFLKNIHKTLERLQEDISVYNLLKLHQQSDKVIQSLWEPIALAALSTPIKEASGMVFLAVLQKFLSQPKHSDWLFPKVDLSEVLPNQIIQALKVLGSKILYRERVKSLIIDKGACIGVETDTKKFLGAQIVLATPAHVTAQLLQNSTHNFNYFNSECYQPITTLYLRYANPICLKKPMIGLMNSTCHWIFDRAFALQPNLLSVVITGIGPHTDWDQEQLIKTCIQELKAIAPQVSATLKEDPIACRLITEKRAAFSCNVGIEKQRPAQTTAFPNVWIAGDYTQPGYPATLESAVQSGIEVAKLILCLEE